MTSSETFDLHWRELPSLGLFLETHPVAPDEEIALPGPMRVGGTLLIPVQGIVSSEGRFVSVPNEDALRAVWTEIPGHRVDVPVPTPLAGCWTDWVERWIGVTPAPGTEQLLPVRTPDERASIRCERLDTESAHLQYRWIRPFPGRAAERVEGSGDTARSEPWTELEQGVDAQLGDGIRPRTIRVWSNWRLCEPRGVVRSVEAEDRYTFDWAAAPETTPAAWTEPSEPPRPVASWAERRWPELNADELRADAAWWDDVWGGIDDLRRAQVVAGVSVPPADLGSGRGTRAWWMRVQPSVRRLWLAESPLERPELRVRSWIENGPPEGSVDMLFVGDGYDSDDLDSGQYWDDVCLVAQNMFEEVPLRWYRHWFNVRAAFVESRESGCDQGAEIDEVDTVLDSYRNGGRGLIQYRRDQKLLEIVRAAGGADIVLVMVNEKVCGGTGGRLPNPARASPLAAPTFSIGCPDPALVALHEVGHSFANLADEYVDPEMAFRFSARRGGELDAPNVTRNRRDARHLKWRHFLELPGAERFSWRHEGGYYLPDGVFRPWPRCRMRDSADPLCPVCTEAMAQAIYLSCGLKWDDDAYHRAHPLDLWRQ